MCSDSPKRTRRKYWSGIMLVGWRVQGIHFLEEEGLELTFGVLFSEHALGASVEISADGTYQKYIFLFISFLVPWRNLAPRVLWRSNKSAFLYHHL